jgi:hypothetical protein
MSDVNAYALLTRRFGAARTGHTSTYIPAGGARRDEWEDMHMTMPSDAADGIEADGANEGPRNHRGVDTDHDAYVDENNVPHPGDANEAR